MVPENRGGWPEAEHRANAELQALGFDVVRATATAPDKAQLAALVQKTHTLAAVQFLRVGASEASGRAPVSIYLVDRSTGKSAVRRIGHERLGERLTAEQAALLAAELVYAMLVEVPEQRVKPAKPQPPSPTVTVPPAPRRHEVRWNLRAGLSAGGSAGGASVFGGALLALGYRPAMRIGLDLAIDLPALPARVSAAGGTAELYALQSRFHVLFLATETSRHAVGLGLGGGILTAHSTGAAEPPLVSTSDHATAGLASAMGLGVWRLTPAVGLTAALRAALAIPELRVSFAGQEVARFGRPLVDGSVGCEWRW